MPQAITAQLKAHLAGRPTTLTMLCKVTRRGNDPDNLYPDTEQYGFTHHYKDIAFQGLTYEAASGISASEFASRAGLSVDNMNVLGALDSASITEEDLIAGKWDYAKVEFFIVNYADLTQGRLYVASGTLGEISIGDTEYEAEIRGTMQPVQNTFGRAYLPACDADWGDARCGLDPEVFPDGKVTTTVTTAAVGARRQFIASGITQAAEWFTYGKLVWTSGLNQGVVSVVKQHTTGGNITLQLPTPYNITPSDGFYVLAGCDKTAAMCKAKFNNKINFRGFDKIPGRDRVMSGLA